MGSDYNGWTNYETWNLALWIGNEENSYNYWQQERARDAYRDATAEKSFTRLERAALDLADALKNDIEENIPEVAGFYADVLRAAVSEVNWYEIAENWIEEVADEIEAEEKAAATE